MTKSHTSRLLKNPKNPPSHFAAPKSRVPSPASQVEHLRIPIPIRIPALFLSLFLPLAALATTYHIDALTGNDRNDGRSPQTAFHTLSSIGKITLAPGDTIILAAGQCHTGMLALESASGTEDKPIVITSSPFSFSAPDDPKATIDAKGQPSAVSLNNCVHIIVENLRITANGGGLPAGAKPEGRFGVLITADKKGVFSNITVRKVDIDGVFYENPGFVRDPRETNTDNGTQNYGWGIRAKYNGTQPAQLDRITIQDCTITNVSHTGIRVTGDIKGNRFISNLRVTGNKVTHVGGPGVVGLTLRDAYFARNTIDHTGSERDSRNWKRGSGLWTWGSTNVLIEHNSFTNANGPMDSAGTHIDFNCANVVVQYNFSANNIGSFVEILGNDHNCAYRYNISVNDGWRQGENLNAGHMGKTIWITGYIGGKNKRTGPFNSYIYNNTIYVKSDIQAKIAIENTAQGVLIANNIFCIEGKTITAPGDNYNPRKAPNPAALNTIVKNNLFLHKQSWPADNIQDTRPLHGDPGFAKKGGLALRDYIPSNTALLNQGIDIAPLPGDNIGLTIGLKPDRDILGTPITGKPTIGAIQVE